MAATEKLPTPWGPYTPESGAASHFLGDPSAVEAWCYTDQLSYAAGALVRFHVSATTPTVELSIERDGPAPHNVYESGPVAADYHRPSTKCYEHGCGWPVAHELRVPTDWSSGVYTVRITARRGTEQVAGSAQMYCIYSMFRYRYT